MTTRESYNLGVPWMTKWSKLARYNTKTSEFCGPCCDNSAINEKHAPAMVLCCMDFRLRDAIPCNLNRLGYKNKYDEVIAAGVSLGYNNALSGYEDASWNVYINSHFDLGYALHTINQIIIIEHEKCGAYAVTYGDPLPEPEINYHIDNIVIAGETIWNLYNPINGTTMTTNPDTGLQQHGIPNLEIIGYYININASEFTKIYEKTETGTFIHAKV